MRPLVSPVTDKLYARLPEKLREPDEDVGWHLLHFLQSFMQSVQPVEDLVRDTSEGEPGWSALEDINRIDQAGLGWLAQQVGVQLLTGLSDAAQRQRVRDTAGMKRGTPAALLNAAKSTLTGNQTAKLIERVDGFAYRERLITYTAETPDPDATCRAAKAQKAGGLILECVVRAGQTWGELRDQGTPPGRTWGEVKAEYTNWGGVRDDIPT